LIKTQTATKIVPLEKITDLNISQGFLQRKLGVEEVGLQTASSSPQRPVMILSFFYFLSIFFFYSIF